MADSDLIEQILISLRRVIRAIDQHSRHLVSSHGLTGPQALMLTEIIRSENITGSELAKRVSLSQATVTDVVKRMESRGLLTRIRDDVDKRKIYLQATEHAKSLIAQSVPLLQVDFANRLKQLQDWEQMQLLSSLQRIAEMMNAKDLDAAPLLTSGPIAASEKALQKVFSEENNKDS